MQFDILTIFPDIIYGYVKESILGRAEKSGKIKITAHNFRDFTKDKHDRVDDSPYGGGAGMILQVQPIYECLKDIGLVKDGKKLKIENCKPASPAGGLKIVVMDPAGKKFDQRMAEKFSKLDRLVLICGRYQGFDERVYKFVDEKISVGDYVLSGGELPALTITEAVSRLLPGVLGNTDSLAKETHGKVQKSKTKIENCKLKIENSVAEPPQYTRPPEFMGLKVPKVLLSGNHKLIEEWRSGKTKK